jgi:NosR/NirI family nitrous oxide reductase transcriptional regulator
MTIPLIRLIFIALTLFQTGAFASAYEAPLPHELATDPDLCAYVACRDVIQADRFSPRKGHPPYAEAFRTEGGKKILAGYVFLSTDIVDIPGYSGKPIVTLIGMDTRGIITGIKVLKHSEPILLVGIPEPELARFIHQYFGKFAGDKIEVGQAREGVIGIDAISGATVTVIAENQLIQNCVYEIAKQVGILKPIIRPQARFTPQNKNPDWQTLLGNGGVQHLLIKPEDLGQAATGRPYIDLYFGYLNAPAVGEAILGRDNYHRLMGDLAPDDHAIFIIANGSASFKGSGFVRGGIYDRIQVSQDMASHTFRDTDYRNLYGIQAAGAPAYSESGIFILHSKEFSAAYPWNLVLLANKEDKETRTKTFTNFDREYWLPGAYLQGGRPYFERPEPTWLHIWKSRRYQIAAFVVLLIGTAVIYALRDKLVRRATRRDKRWVSIPKYLIWGVSTGFVGFYLMAQPSITQILAWFHSLLYHWQWELFLSDPFIFIFWWFIIITVFIWGRGLFCGWLCPYGALSEMAFKFGRLIGLRRFQFLLPRALHDKLKWLKYMIFAVLLATSFYSMGLAEKLAEVEPFKTTFLVGVGHRAWPYVLFWSILFGLSIFTERPFCKYLCPLGAGLAIPSTFRFFGLKRKSECSTCTACAAGCGSQAIDKQGAIDQRECMLCLDCMVLYYDVHSCPPLSQERKRREKTGQALTPISAKGYYIPIKVQGK